MNIKLNEKVFNFLSKNAQRSTSAPIETESFYNSLDLLCEGPIEGFSNSDGKTVGYLEIENALTPVGSSIYFNNTPVVDPQTNLFNFAQSSIIFDTGMERKKTRYIASSLLEYKLRIYDIPTAIVISKKLPPLVQQPLQLNNSDISIKVFKSSDQKTQTELNDLIKIKSFAPVVNHKVLNKYASFYKFSISIDNLYQISGNDTVSAPIAFVIEARNLSTGISAYLMFNGSFVAKGGQIVLPFEISFSHEDGDFLNTPFPEVNLSVFSIQESVLSKTNIFRSFSLDSVVEMLAYGFTYPYSCAVNTTISSKHFNNIPTRSYDCKLLKIRVPDNYDGEIREYIGNWSGNFNLNLKWTNNPAWVFYDLCVNSRYGMAKGHINETDLDKWQFLSLSKFCDELIKTNSKTKFEADLFDYDNDIESGKLYYNNISFNTSEPLEKLQLKYPVGSILYLYDIKNSSGENININYKKIICSVQISGGKAYIRLCNDFGPRKILETDLSGNLFNELMNFVKRDPSKNIEDKIKLFILQYMVDGSSLNLPTSKDESVSKTHLNYKIFDKSLNVSKGYCVAKHVEYNDFLEPRFSCNVLINNESEGLKTLSDLSSIFRGIFYFKNGLLSLTSDVKQKPVYIFTNSNVKDGLFTYASSDLNTSFSVAKVPYLDKTDNYKDKIVYAEDQDLIRKYGIVEKEILSFGITSRSEAQRIGKWYLATGKLESEVVGFSTGLEATLLQIGNVIRLSDQLKNANIIYGKIVSLDFENQYIYIDREISSTALGANIKILSIINEYPVELDFTVIELDNTNLRLKLLSHAYMNWFIVNQIIVENNGLLLRSGNETNAFDKKAYTNNSFIDNCQISYTSPFASADRHIVGLSIINNPKNDESDINYGLQIIGGVLSIFQSGGSSPTVPVAHQSVTTSDILKITYDGEYIRYYKNNILLVNPVSRSKGQPLHGVVALYQGFSRVDNLNFSKLPDITYGQFANIRSGAVFSIYVNDSDSDFDLYKIISINEVSSNEYAISAMKYQNEKFNIIDNDEYIDASQNKPKQITFSTDNIVSELFTDAELYNFYKLFSINYAQAIKSDFDYRFLIEIEVLNADYFSSAFEYMNLNFLSMFDNLSSRSITNVYGIMCVINRNGKTLNFNILKNEARIVSVFLGESLLGNFSAKTSLDLYAFDSNFKIINV